MKRLATVLILITILGGCLSNTPQAISISPKVDIPQSQVGKGRDLLVYVADDRPKKTLGTLAVAAGGDISIEGDLVTSVQRAVNEGMSRMSFKTTAIKENAKSELRVEIRNLDYTVIERVCYLTLRIDAALKGICIREGNRLYEKLYHGDFEKTIYKSQSKEANSQYINTAVSTAVNALLSDKELIACLAQ